MSSKCHIIELAKNLEKSQKNQDMQSMVSILESLDDVTMTTKLLKETKVGKTVNFLAKSNVNNTDSDIYQLSKALCDKWKNMVSQHLKKKKLKNGKTLNGYSDQQNIEKKNKKKIKKSKHLNGTIPNNDNHSNSHDEHNDNNNKNEDEDDDLNMNHSSIGREEYDWRTGDTMRDKIISKLGSVLKPSPDKKEYVDHMKLSADIEQALCEMYESKSAEYKQQYYDLHFNLKKNNELKLNALLENYSAQQLAVMDSKDMANNELKQRREKDKKWAMDEARNDLKLQASMAMTDEYKCGKCKSRKCKYSQAQTRAADEPMTTFVSCLNCGNRWKC